VREESMVAHPDAYPSRYPPQQECHDESLLVEEEEGSYCTSVERDEDQGRHPDQGLFESPVSLKAAKKMHKVHLL
jgi:hypothetical protein